MGNTDRTVLGHCPNTFPGQVPKLDFSPRCRLPCKPIPPKLLFTPTCSGWPSKNTVLLRPKLLQKFFTNPDPPTFVFFSDQKKKQGKPRKSKGFSLCGTPKIIGKERKHAQKSKETRTRKTNKETRKRKKARKKKTRVGGLGKKTNILAQLIA